MLRMLEKLAQYADGSSGIHRQHALESVQEQVSDLVVGWAPNDATLGGYSSAFSDMATTEADFFAGGEQRAKAEPRRVVDMAFEMDVVGDSVTSVVRQLIETEDASWLLDRVADNKSGALTRSLIGSTLEFGHLLQKLLDNEAVDPSILDTLLELVGESAVEAEAIV